MPNNRFINSYSLDIAIFRLNLPAWLIALCAVVFYYGLPLGFSLYDGSFVTKPWIAANAQFNPFPWLPVPSLLERVAKMTHGVGYAQDVVHTLFSCLVFVGVLACVAFLRHVNVQIPAMEALIKTTVGRAHFKQGITFWSKLSRNLLWSLACLLSAIGAGSFFYATRNALHMSWWWGHFSNGSAGLAMCAVVGVMVYFGLKFLGTLLSAMALLRTFLQQPIHIDPFHKDRANGLLPVGKVIRLFWVCSTIIGLAVSLVIYAGHLDLNKSALGWWLSIFGILSIPLLSVIP